MASNSKICKLKISLSDIERNHYDTLILTVAQHPSETIERMMVRINSAYIATELGECEVAWVPLQG